MPVKSNSQKPWAYLVRESTAGQRELSPESQLEWISDMEEEYGCHVPKERIINITWASQELLECPDIKHKLIPWIDNEEIGGLGMLHSDRLWCSPGESAYLDEKMKRHGVKPVAKFAPFEEGEHSTIMAALRGQGKMDSVVNNRPRIKEGILDRARLHGLPTNSKAPYGFRFVFDDKRMPVKLVPDPRTYHGACLIWRLTKEPRWAIRGICRSLFAPPGGADPVPSPSGRDSWGPHSVYNILINPVYYGVHHAGRHEAVEPSWREKPGFGKSSSRLTPRESWIPLPDFPVEGAIVTKEEYDEVQRQLTKNKKYSPRNSKRFYLLSGMLFSPTCGRAFSPNGQNGRSDYYYVCSRYGQKSLGIYCACPGKLYGPTVEAQVWEGVKGFLRDPEQFMVARERLQDRQSEESINQRLRELNRQLQHVTTNELTLLDEELQGRYSDPVLSKKAAELRGQRVAIEEAKTREEAALATLHEARSGYEALASMRENLLERLDSATAERKRWILRCFDARVEVGKDGILVDLGGVHQMTNSVPNGQI